MKEQLLQQMVKAQAREKGQGLVEYALILVLVAVVVIVILALLGPAIGNIFSTVMCGLKNGGKTASCAASSSAAKSAGCTAIAATYPNIATASFMGSANFNAGETVTWQVITMYGPAFYVPTNNGAGLVGYTAPASIFSYAIPSTGSYNFGIGYNIPGNSDVNITCSAAP